MDQGTFSRNPMNLFAGTNVTAIVIEVPAEVTGSGTIGFWATTALDDHHGGWLQINRCAKPLVNTLFDVTEAGAEDYNATDPRDDVSFYGELVRKKVAALVAANATNGDPDGYGEAVRDIIFPDVLRYQAGTEAGFGARSRNGRGLTEPAPEAMFEMVLNAPIAMGLDAGDATGTLRTTFPYLGEVSAQATLHLAARVHGGSPAPHSTGAGKPDTVPDTGLDTVLDKVPVREWAEREVQPLRDAGSEQAIQTLQVWLAHGARLVRTAEVLGVSVAATRKRLVRLEQTLGRTLLNAPPNRHDLWLALRIAKLLPAA